MWSWSFDAQGRVTRAVSPTGTIGYEYDALGRKTRTWTSDSVDPAVPDNSLASDTRYEYDAFGRLSTLRVLRVAGETLSGTEVQTTRYQYDLAGRLVRQTNPNGTIALYAYDTLGRLTKLTHYAPDSSPEDLSNNAKLAEFDDEHNASGHRTSTTETFRFDGWFTRRDGQRWCQTEPDLRRCAGAAHRGGDLRRGRFQGSPDRKCR